MKLIWIFPIILLTAVPVATYAQKTDDLYGVWRMVSYSRDGKPSGWTGMMIITREHFSRSYMAPERPLVRDQYDTPSDLSDQEKEDMVVAFHQKYGGASGTYRMEGNRLILDPLYPANTRLLGRHPQRTFELNRKGTQLTLRGTMTRGYEVVEVWEKLEDLE